jgi:predicted nucleic acid-binding Zn ribbon protein
VVQSFTDTAISTCPNCDGAVRKVYSNVGVVFKGSGFYKTDSRSATKSETPKATPAPVPAPAPAKESSSD